MAAPRFQPFPRIARNGRILDGEPAIDGTRIPVRSIVIMYHLYRDIDRIIAAFPHVDRSAVEEALAFYEMHREEIDRYIAENETDED